jgi:MFS family permease
MGEKKNGKILLIANTAIWMASAVYAPFIGAYYTEQGISTFQIGILTAIGPLAAIGIQPFWAYISDKTGKRRQILALVCAGSGVAILGYLLGNGFPGFVLATLCFTAFQTAILPLGDALISNLAQRQGQDFARIRMGGTIGYALVALALGKVLSPRSYIMFPLGCIGFLILAVIILQLPKEEFKAAKKEAGQSADKRIFKNNWIYLVFFVAFILQVGLTACISFYSVYLIQLGYSQTLVGVSSFISAMSEVPILMVANRLVKKFKPIRMLEFSVFMLAIRISLAGSGILPLMLVSQLLQSVTYMTSYYGCIVFINENVVEGKISQGQSRLAIVQTGAGAIVGSILGGVLTQAIGIRATFMLMAGVMIVAGFVSLAVDKKMRVKGGYVNV